MIDVTNARLRADSERLFDGKGSTAERLLPTGTVRAVLGDKCRPIIANELADEAGIGRRTMQRADKVNEQGAKAVKDAVTAGEVSVSDAASIVALPKDEQAKAVKAVKSGKAKTLKAAGKKATSPPVSGPDCKALYKEWERSIGPLVRLVDRIAGQVNGKNGDHHQTVQDHLNIATEEMMEWLGVSK